MKANKDFYREMKVEKVINQQNFIARYLEIPSRGMMIPNVNQI